MPDRQRLVLLLQGGLGNQLLQMVLGEALAASQGRQLQGSTVLLDSRSRRFRGLTTRSMSPLVRGRLPCLPVPWHRYLPSRLRARLADPASAGVLTDRGLGEAACHPGLLQRLDWVRVIHSHATHPALFGPEFTPAWQAMLEALGPHRRLPAPWVAVHVRRTDYLHPRSGFQPLAASYYRAALALATGASAAAAPVLVNGFSDDPAWCRAHLQDPRWRLEVSAGTPEQDLAAMAQAQVLITGNSSLSAVAAHLAQLRDPGTRVYTPERWLRKEDGRLGDLRKPGWQVVRP
ncbi:alpha-1,2-fucosyltransferase [Synechococcus sp. CCY 9618]|uniref:alpha-1,2-fucosyltransferase n=1 Tax=Synechococcus sp. CCY 9618 TaxID=2815602 RepID=UPI001C23DE42|nr:alpha-1,2-fucosyltransferase [Synechococcus sp. CCY 9618]